VLLHDQCAEFGPALEASAGERKHVGQPVGAAGDVVAAKKGISRSPRSAERLLEGDDVLEEQDAALPVSWRRWTPVIQRARR
jgi:hypothetical protein